MQRSARTFAVLVLLLPITTTTFAAHIADQAAALPIGSRRNSVCRNNEALSPIGNRDLPDNRVSLKDTERALVVPNYDARSKSSSQAVLWQPSRRSLMPSVPFLRGLFWEEIGIVFNASASTSYLITRFYGNITALLGNCEVWLAPATHILIYSLGAVKLIFDIRARERPISWHLVQDFILEFITMMIHIARSLLIVAYRLVAFTAIATYVITLQIVVNASQRDLVTGPVI